MGYFDTAAGTTPVTETLTYSGTSTINAVTGVKTNAGSVSGILVNAATGAVETVSASGLASVDDASTTRLGGGNFGPAINIGNTHSLPISNNSEPIGTTGLYRKLTTSTLTDTYAQKEVSADFSGLCPDDYEVTYRYQKRQIGTAGWMDAPDLNVKEYLKVANSKMVTVTHQTRPPSGGFEYTVNRISTTSSGCNVAQLGSAFHNVASIHTTIPLGKLDALNGAGALHLDAYAVTSALYSPAALEYFGPNIPSIEIVRATLSDPASPLRQIKTPQLLADIVTLSASSYEVRLYHSAQIGTQNSGTQLYSLAGAPFVTHLFENPDTGATTRLKVTETRPDKVKSVTYAFDAATSTWSLIEGDGLRVTSIATSTDATTGDVTKTTTLQDIVTPAATPSEQIASVTARTTRSFPWGLSPVSEVLDPAGAALTTTYTYYENAATDGPNYAHLKTRQDPNGYWERYTYDSGGRIATVASPHLTAPITAADSACRVVSTDRTPLLDADGDTLPEPRTTTIESLLGVETTRTYEIEWTAPVTFSTDSCTRTTTVRTTAPGIAWDSTSNTLTTETLRYATGPFAGRLRRELRPDGTATLVIYALDATSGDLTTTTATGLPNAACDAITAGEQTVTVTNSAGHIISSDLVRIDATPANLLLESWLVTEFDSLGRPTRTDYTDGTYSTRTYACCGLSSERDRQGNTTSYTYDDLGRRETQTSNGITLKTTRNAADNTRRVVRYPAATPAAALTVSETDYDLAGRLTATRDPLGRQTTITETFAPSTGETTVLQTLPPVSGQAATIQTITAPDGRTLRRTGTATAPVRYDYGITALTGLADLPDANALNYPAGTPFTTTQEIKLDATGADTLEITTSYTDPLGNAVKILYAGSASPAIITRYDASGRPLRQTDPDGVQTLTTYSDALGTATTTALDLIPAGESTRNGTIDESGTDRITRTTTTYTTRDAIPIRRTTTEIWETSSSAAPTTVSTTDATLDGLRTWQTTRGLTTTQVITPGENGARAEVTTNADGTVQTRTYTTGRLTAETITHPALGTLASLTRDYDDYGRLWHLYASTGTTTYTYFDDDQLKTVTTPDPDTTRTGPGYDPQTTTYHDDDNDGLIERVTLPDATETTTTYWPTGQVKQTSGSRTYPQAYTYDPQGRVKTLTTWQNFSSSAGAAVTTWNYHPQRGWLASKRDNNDKGADYDYWPSGRLKTRDWARTLPSTTTRLRTSYTYNSAGDLETVTYNDDATAFPTPPVAHNYDRLGRLETTTDAAGLLTRTYDPASGQLAGEAYTGTGLLSGRAIARSFNTKQRLQSLATNTGYGVAYDYDDVGRLSSLSEGFHLAKYGYKPNVGSVETVTIKRAGVERVRHQRTTDNLGRISQVKTTTGASIPVQRGYTFNDANQRTQIAHEDTRRWAYDYDDLGQVTSAQKRLANDTTPLPGYTFGYTFDDIGNRVTSTTNSRTTSYAPNPLNQYDNRTIPGAFDVRGEALTTATVTVNTESTIRSGKDFYREVTAANGSSSVNASIAVSATESGQTVNETRSAFLAQTPESYTHDLDGNLKQDGQWVYTWNADNRLVAMETRSDVAQASGLPRQSLEYTYDTTGRRIRNVEKSWNSSTNEWVITSDLRYLYNGWCLLTELEATNNNTPVQSHVWGLDVSETMQGAAGAGGLLWTNTVTHTFAACADANANIVSYINTATLTVAGRTDYAPFGEIIQQTGVAKELSFGFSSCYTDNKTGNIMYILRPYDPIIGRFLCSDPIGESGGINIYGMSGNSPTNSYDILGLGIPIQNHHPVSPYQDPLQTHPLVRRAGVSLQYDQTLVRLENHAGPHSPSYHAEVKLRLDAAWESLGPKPSREAARSVFSSVVGNIIDDIESGKLKPYDNKDVRVICRLPKDTSLSKFANLGDKLVYLGFLTLGADLITGGTQAKAQELRNVAIGIASDDKFAEIELISATDNIGYGMTHFAGLKAYADIDKTMSEARKMIQVDIQPMNSEDLMDAGGSNINTPGQPKPFTGQKEGIIITPDGKAYVYKNGKLISVNQ